jgi:hypothetical protein
MEQFLRMHARGANFSGRSAVMLHISGFEKAYPAEGSLFHTRRAAADELANTPPSSKADTCAISSEAREAFGRYMDHARGNHGESSDVESLRARLKELRNKLSSVAKEETVSEETKNSGILVIQQEIAQVTAQIAEMETQAA